MPNILTLRCHNCNAIYDVEDYGDYYLIYDTGKHSVHAEEISCPFCGSVSYRESFVDETDEDD